MSKYFNEECPICLCDFEQGKIHVTPCMHRLHLKCAEDLMSFECQNCNQHVNNYPIYIVEKIIDHKKKYEKKMEEKDLAEFRRYDEYRRRVELQRLQAEYGPRSVSDNGSTAVEPGNLVEGPIKKQIIAVMQVMKQLNIPLRYIPIEIKVEIYKHQPPIPQDYIFCHLLSMIMDKVCKDLGDYNLLQDDNVVLSDYGVENPFEAENVFFSTLQRGIDIQIID